MIFARRRRARALASLCSAAALLTCGAPDAPELTLGDAARDQNDAGHLSADAARWEPGDAAAMKDARGDAADVASVSPGVPGDETRLDDPPRVADAGRVSTADGSLDGAARGATFLIGADITFVQAEEARGVTYSDGRSKEILRLLGDHGFNAIRVRTFVDPRARDGYDKQQGFADLAHTIAFAQRVKRAGMSLLLDFHYSDNWADPGKQCVPVAWQGMTLAQMSQALHDYTKNALAELVAAGARPDMVQIGNEITAGMLLHLCDDAGMPTGDSVVNGSVANWAALGSFLKAGIAGVREVDPSIKIMLHLDRGGDKPADRPGAALQTSIDWVSKALQQGVAFDVLGQSSYQLYQGDPSSTAKTAAGWASTYAQLASRFPALEFVAAEYGPMQREINDVVFNLPAGRGLGTFNWEPTRQTTGSAGHTLFATTGNPRAATADLTLYDLMRSAYQSRL